MTDASRRPLLCRTAAQVMQSYCTKLLELERVQPCNQPASSCRIPLRIDGEAAISIGCLTDRYRLLNRQSLGRRSPACVLSVIPVFATDHILRKRGRN